ncbi:MAG: hypothetical protein ACXAE3_07030 [Candidatus Kariarchaeaceae archaeon]|jgi:heptaprenylglyceryl phosphate synthase
MKTALGILGDPAKEDLYHDDFYSLLTHQKDEPVFYLLGASERDVTRKQYRKMYDKLISSNPSSHQFTPIPGLTSSSRYDIRSRIGLFPSGVSQLIKGPSFAFASYPANSQSRNLQIRAKLLSTLLTPILPFKVLNIAYYPLGGKAAGRTKARDNITLRQIKSEFRDLRIRDNQDWYYLEAGSGQKSLPSTQIQEILLAQAAGYLSEKEENIRKALAELPGGSRVVVPRSIYGGGIVSVDNMRNILAADQNDSYLVPEIVIIGNISEDDISMTYRIAEEVNRINLLPNIPIDNLRSVYS